MWRESFWFWRMGTRTATNALVKRTTFSSAINIFPNEVANSKATASENINESDSVVKHSTQIRPYSEVPGPKGLPLLGNSWRFAPLIGKIYIYIYCLYFYLPSLLLLFTRVHHRTRGFHHTIDHTHNLFLVTNVMCAQTPDNNSDAMISNNSL